MAETATVIEFQLRAPASAPSQDEVVERFRRWWGNADQGVRSEIRKIVRADGEAWRAHWGDAEKVLEHLNAKRRELEPSTRGYRASNATMRFICQRLHEGASVSDLKAIIAIKSRQVRGGDFSFKYLRPETLFNATKCESYLGELGASS